jgi:hypothetical protein
MRVVIFGASGMVGQGALQECLRDPDVRRVVSVVRAATGKQHEKLHEIVHQNFLDFTAIEHELTGLDACLFCLGVSSAGISEDAYTRITYGFTRCSPCPFARRTCFDLASFSHSMELNLKLPAIVGFTRPPHPSWL